MSPDKATTFLKITDPEAYKKAKAKFENLELYIAGSLDEKNPSSIQENHFKKLIGMKLLE